MNLKAYLIGAVVVTAFLTAVLAALKFAVIDFMPTWLFVIPPALFLFSAGAFAVLVRTEQRNPSRFVSAFMAAIGGKMFLTLMGVAAYVMLDGSHRLLVSLVIVGCYGVFMAHFTAVASKQLRSSAKESAGQEPS